MTPRTSSDSHTGSITSEWAPYPTVRSRRAYCAGWPRDRSGCWRFSSESSFHLIAGDAGWPDRKQTGEAACIWCAAQFQCPYPTAAMTGTFGTKNRLSPRPYCVCSYKKSSILHPVHSEITCPVTWHAHCITPTKTTEGQLTSFTQRRARPVNPDKGVPTSTWLP